LGHSDQNDQLEKIPTGVLTGPEYYALVKNANLGEGERQSKSPKYFKNVSEYRKNFRAGFTT